MRRSKGLAPSSYGQPIPVRGRNGIRLVVENGRNLLPCRTRIEILALLSVFLFVPSDNFGWRPSTFGAGAHGVRPGGHPSPTVAAPYEMDCGRGGVSRGSGAGPKEASGSVVDQLGPGKKAKVSVEDRRRLVPGEHVPPHRRDERREGVRIEHALQGAAHGLGGWPRRPTAW